MVCLSALIVAPAVAQAQSTRSESGADSGPIVRRQLLFRSSRLEVAPMVAFSINDAFIRNTLVGANVSYHLNNVFGVGLTVGYGALQMDTTLRDNVHASLTADDPRRLNSLSYSYMKWTADLGISYVPIFGKFTIFNGAITHYDIHLMGGLSVVGEDVVGASVNSVTDPGLAGTRPGGMLGVGLRFFVSDMISINYEIRDYIYSRAQVSRGAANPQLSNNVIMSLGVGIFLPGDVKISR